MGMRAGAALLALGATAMAGLMALPAQQSDPAPGPIAVTLMTALPLLWGEGDIAAVLAGRSMPAPIVTALEDRVRFVAIDTIDAASLAARPLMLAQPRALAPAELVALDRWVRRGGRALIFTDPALLWESALPLGDRRRPPATGLLDPVLAHWGLELDFGSAGRRAATINRQPVTVASAGRFRVTKPGCSLAQNGLIASCPIGRGRALLIADADLLDARWWTGSREAGVPGLVAGLLTSLASAKMAGVQERTQNSDSRETRE